jgi:outer membrane protein OmpA-like peptidoglycan-associated protein
LTEEGEFLYAGLEITENALGLDSSFQDTIDVVIDDLLADLENTFDIQEQTAEYRSAIMARMHLGATYDLYENLTHSGSANFLFQSEFYKGKMRPTFTLGYKQNVGKWLSANIAYSVIDRNFRNLGLGLSITGPVQFYIATDNVLAGVMNRIDIGDPVITDIPGLSIPGTFSYPSHARTMQIHTGINVTLGKKPSDRDGDGIKDKKDVCPDTPGVAEFDGCPDSDGDGVQDSQDECPNTPGLKEFAGCPDTDLDGIPDRTDTCPEVAGLPEFEGCPDTDGDGIQDSEDECVETPGLPEFAGCPDTDGDGVRDLNDDCPEIVGEKENRGCPWLDTDEDGLLDKDDGCPTIAGPAENNGCPYTDTDGDTVLDKDDDCVFTPGPVENKGCPVIEEAEQEVLNTAFENLEFVSGKSVIKEESFISLTELAALLVTKPEWKLQISGHTDDVGKAAANMKLSENRSKAVAAFIESQGVALDRIVVKWFGEDSPVADNETAEGRQTNRRVEMEVVFD